MFYKKLRIKCINFSIILYYNAKIISKTLTIAVDFDDYSIKRMLAWSEI